MKLLINIARLRREDQSENENFPSSAHFMSALAPSLAYSVRCLLLLGTELRAMRNPMP
jgi:hypothetical protein